ncbi:DNA/RNA non-specific endonuclease [Streptomyces mirabilis]|uniref:DNA/RNA non-specific endonuclease n=2 Tax=Streptomyces mirabilis TaxID=68239 RepID=UPI00331FFDFD
MNAEAERTHRTSRSRRNSGRHAVVPALTALLLPVLSAGPAAAATSTMPRTATAPASTEVPASVSVSGGLPSDIVLKDVIPYNNKVKELERRKTELTTEKQSLTKKAAKVNSQTDTYNTKDATCAARVKAHNSKMDAYEAKVDAWNSTSHDYVVPEQRAAYEAAVAEKEKLDAEGVALHQETASINAEQKQLDVEEAQLGVEQAELTTEMTDHNAQVATWTSDQQQLETQHQQLLVEIATALQDQLDTPPTQATSMAQGGDATGPLEPTAQAAQAPGGDATSRAGQVASISYYAVKNKAPVKFQPVVAQLSPSTISKQSASAAAQLAPTATYDGLLPEENGHYKAIEIQTSTANTSQGRTAFNNALAHGGQATARLNGRPVVIDGTVTVPADDRTKDRCNKGPSFTDRGIFYIVYLPLHEQAGACVASGAFAQLGLRNYTNGKRPRLGFPLPGLTTLPLDNRARGHLIGYAMGGSNKDTRNFVPLYQQANQWMYTHAEDPVVKAIKAGGSVYVEAYPRYGDPDSVLPTSIDYDTQGDVQEECVIKNNPTGAGSHCRKGS